ncbi:MAG: M48 family metallopeptidase [Burkholderiales bacterium]|nr:M48 family metallopeptidase [Burkholderiales bacterium]
MTDVVLHGRLFDGNTPVGTPVRLTRIGAEVLIAGDGIAQRHPVASVRVSPRIGTADRFVALADGHQVQCPDDRLLDGLPQESRSEGSVAWLERRWPVAVVGTLLVIAMVVGGYTHGLPWAARHIAAYIPAETENALGRETLSWLDSSGMVAASELSDEHRAELRSAFDTLKSGLPDAARLRLEFRAAPDVGPNAFALPGGTIIVTDELVELAESDEEVLAVLAHEIGHVELRHSMRHLIQNSAVAAAIATLTGDVASLTGAVVGVPTVLATTAYSRAFETEADEYAYGLLRRHGIPPAALGDMLERLSEAFGDDDDGGYSFIATHPVTQARVERARQTPQ